VHEIYRPSHGSRKMAKAVMPQIATALRDRGRRLRQCSRRLPDEARSAGHAHRRQCAQMADGTDEFRS
jgi:hypothetical protein